MGFTASFHSSVRCSCNLGRTDAPLWVRIHITKFHILLLDDSPTIYIEYWVSTHWSKSVGKTLKLEGSAFDLCMKVTWTLYPETKYLFSSHWVSINSIAKILVCDDMNSCLHRFRLPYFGPCDYYNLWLEKLGNIADLIAMAHVNSVFALYFSFHEFILSSPIIHMNIETERSLRLVVERKEGIKRKKWLS